MSKSLQKGIIFAVCVALLIALSLTLVFFAGGGDNNLSAPQGQASGVADAAANAYEHGTDSGRRPARIQEGVLRELILPYLPVKHFIMQLKATPRIFFLRAI